MDVCVRGRRGAEVDGLADLTDGGRIAVAGDLILYIIKDRRLARIQINILHWISPFALFVDIITFVR